MQCCTQPKVDKEMDIGGSLSISDSKTYEQLPRNEARVRVA